MRHLIFCLGLVALCVALTGPPARAQAGDEGCIERYESLRREIRSGGPGKDDIPAIDNPLYTGAESAGLEDGERVFGIAVRGLVAAYPRRIMVWHEIVNDVAGGRRISMTWCPLTGSSIGFFDHEFGVSGKLYRSNLVMYDRETDSLFPQMLMTGVSGPLCGKKLETFFVADTTWAAWREAHPDTRVLSENTGHVRDYRVDPYEGWDESPRVMVAADLLDSRLHPKERVVSLVREDQAWAVLQDGFPRRHPDGLSVRLAGAEVRLVWNAELGIVEPATPAKATVFTSFWFAHAAHWPHSGLSAPAR